MDRPKNQSFKLFLLPAYVLFETARAILTYAAIHSGVGISSTFVTLCTELCKAIFATIFLLRDIVREHGSLDLGLFFAKVNIASEQSSTAKWKVYANYLIPSGLYLINNLLYMVGLSLTTPALLHVAILAKLPLTAVIHHVFIRRQHNARAWFSLCILCIGLLVMNITPNLANRVLGRTGKEEPASTVGSFMGVIIGMVIAVLSSFTSIYTEVVLKQDVNFWVAQFWLYVFGSGFAGIAFGLWDGVTKIPSAVSPLNSNNGDSAQVSVIVASFAVILTTTATGLVVANILRKKDNLVKLVGTSASIVTVTATQCLLIADLRASTLTVKTVMGSGLICISTWCYHYYQSERQPQVVLAEYSMVSRTSSEEFDLEDKEMVEDETEKQPAASSSSEADLIEPTLIRVTMFALFVIFLAIATALFGPRS